MTVRVVIPSALAENLISCVQALRACEPDWPAADLIVVDDGARTVETETLPATWVAGVKPFVFARNVNIGIAAAGDSDVILLNDDGRLLTPYGVTAWTDAMALWPTVGVCSAGIHGVVCNAWQQAGAGPSPRAEAMRLAFVCVYLPRRVLDRVGPLDERFTGYGYEDFDYCRRVQQAGFHLAIWDGCVVDHGGAVPSSFRTRADIGALMAQNRQIYDEKWRT